MSHRYRAVGWNPQKLAYDRTIALAVTSGLGIAAAGTAVLNPAATLETILLRSTALTALVLLHAVLSIGPLCRLDRRLLPLLYNRRHLGVTMFLVAAAHGVLAIVQFHAGGDAHPLVSLLTTSRDWSSAERFPFQIAGALALGVLVVMAATSHDFWLRTLTAPVWKTLHMGVYVAYAAIVVHVAFGALQSEAPPAAAWLLGVGIVWLATLHTLAAHREARNDRSVPAGVSWVDAGPAAAIPDGRARIVCAAGERIAVFRYGTQVSAVSNVCQHQNGPLGEGKIVGGCIVCPWHGFEYRPDTGASPPPFTEAVPTFRTRIVDGRVFVDPRPLSPGTWIEPARLEP
ncbi:MAG: Rieske 2Fe-2S domain-containing protein [Acidobacteriota bacterium]